MMSRTLSLAEELMLLALKDEEGTLFSGTMVPYAIGGAIIAELALARRIVVDPDTTKLRVLDPKKTGDPLLDDWLGQMADAGKERRVADWVARVAGKGDLKHRVAVQLVRRGILRASEDKVLLVFTRRIYPELDPRPESELMARLEEAVFSDGDVDARTAILVALADRSLLLKAIFGRKRLAPRKDRLDALAEASVAAGATKDAIDAMQTALMVSAVLPSLVATTVVISN